MKEIELIINEYIALGKIKSDFHVDFDYKKNNSATRKLMKLNTKLKSNLPLARMVIDSLMLNDNTCLKIWINELAINIDYKKEEAINNLIILAEENNNNLYSMDIRLFLSEKGIIASPWGK